MKPDRSNYELWVIDWLDGNLSDEQADELKEFLNRNPDLRDEIEGIALVNLKPGEHLFPLKETVRKNHGSLARAQFEHLCIAYLENDLGPEQRSELLEMIVADEDKKREFELTQKLKLIAPRNIYTRKKRIRKLTTGQKIIRMTAAGLSAAAALAAMISIYLSSPLNITQDTSVASNQSKPDTFLIALNPSITVRKPSDPSFKKIILPSIEKSAVADLQLPEVNNRIVEAAIPSQSDSISQINRAVLISRVGYLSPGKIYNVSFPVPESEGILAYSKYATVPSQFEEDRSNVDRFFARLFHEKIMKDKTGTSPVKTFDLAVAGINGLNKLFGWQIALHKNTDANGEVKSYKFSSRLLKFNTPVKKGDSL